MQHQCDMREENGKRCTAIATHRWGNTHCCCRHCDQITSLLADLNQAVAERRYADLLALYENYSRQIAKLTAGFQSFPGDATG